MSENQEHINIVTTNTNSWNPCIGNETLSLLDHLSLPLESREILINETIEILSQCGHTSLSKFSEVGLVFGYVQSGKTMSFTTLTALAKDNGYKIIIIIAGISTNLVSQSFTRLEKDLRIDERTDMQWLSFRNPKRSELEIRNQVQNALRNWNDPTFPHEDRQTILITVMKQKDHLPNLCDLLQSIDINGVPILIIDDEGDQHSMNNQNRRNARTGNRRMSTIHRRIVELRSAIPNHTFIQYTATPQGPLFQDLMDDLSPKFIQLLTPGQNYTGGRCFFSEMPELTEVINDIDPQHLQNTPPESLLKALMIFFLGVAKGKPMREGKNRSMMIHPSQLTYTHSEYSRIVNNIKSHFIETLSLPDTDPDKRDLLLSFHNAYKDLAKTTTDLPPFDELTRDNLRHAISSTVIQSLNSTGNNRTAVQWRNSYSWILIGGQAMDRGFTVEGLTVTYMPRGVGVGNADTIQQRARFFGYKRAYIGYCRVFLDGDARDRYIRYVEHEEDMRRRLREHKNSGKSLDEWYREVFLNSNLNLSRREIFSQNFRRAIFGSKWNVISVPHHEIRNIENNRLIVQEFLNRNHFTTGERFPVFQGSLFEVYNSFLCQLRFNSSEDVGDYTALLYLLERHLEEFPEEWCTIYLMSTFEKRRYRTLGVDNQIEQYFQGRNDKQEGLRDIRGNGITFQIYVFDLENGDEKFESVVGLASYIPIEISEDLISWEE